MENDEDAHEDEDEDEGVRGANVAILEDKLQCSAFDGDVTLSRSRFLHLMIAKKNSHGSFIDEDQELIIDGKRNHDIVDCRVNF